MKKLILLSVILSLVACGESEIDNCEKVVKDNKTIYECSTEPIKKGLQDNMHWYDEVCDRGVLYAIGGHFRQGFLTALIDSTTLMPMRCSE